MSKRPVRFQEEPELAYYTTNNVMFGSPDKILNPKTNMLREIHTEKASKN